MGHGIDRAWTWRASEVFSLTVFQHGIEHDDLKIIKLKELKIQKQT